VRQQVGQGEQHDDVSWVLWTVPDAPTVSPTASAPASGGQPVLSLDLAFSPQAIGHSELGPRLAKLLGDFGLPSPQTQSLALTLAEGLNNAAEHGLLALDSALKQTSWSQWEATRVALLAQEKRSLHLKLRLYEMSDPPNRFCRVEAEVEDPGQGFDWRQVLARTGGTELPHGRGLELIRALTREMHFNEKGNLLTFTIAGS
jgi:anti-sigma regulatory factor (Ser/Thr protein kinase)